MIWPYSRPATRQKAMGPSIEVRNVLIHVLNGRMAQADSLSASIRAELKAVDPNIIRIVDRALHITREKAKGQATGNVKFFMVSPLNSADRKAIRDYLDREFPQ